MKFHSIYRINNFYVKLNFLNDFKFLNYHFLIFMSKSENLASLAYNEKKKFKKKVLLMRNLFMGTIFNSSPLLSDPKKLEIYLKYFKVVLKNLKINFGSLMAHAMKSKLSKWTLFDIQAFTI